MIDIIPNWHPVFVHFTIGLLGISVLMFVTGLIIRERRYRHYVDIMAVGSLWLGTIFGIITAIAGWIAYNSVVHDTPSHAAMTIHRNWALGTLSVFMLVTLWSVFHVRRKKTSRHHSGFIFVIVLSGGLLATTGWYGGEAVYRYGLGVMSMPKPETGGAGGHSHGHGDKGDTPGHKDKSNPGNANDHGSSGHAD